MQNFGAERIYVQTLTADDNLYFTMNGSTQYNSTEKNESILVAEKKHFRHADPSVLI